MATWHLLALFVLAVGVLLIADYLASQAHVRRARRRRLEQRITELKRESFDTRSDAP